MKNFQYPLGKGLLIAILAITVVSSAFAQQSGGRPDETPRSFPPVSATPQGVPFPSMVPAAPVAQQSSGPGQVAHGTAPQNKGPVVPLSTQSMGIDERQVESGIDRAQTQSERRLDNMRLGDGHMSLPDVGSYKNILDRISENQRQILLLQSEQQKADMAMKLWSTTFDPRREEAAAKGEDSDSKKAEEAAKAEAAHAADVKRNEASTINQPPMIPFPRIYSIGGIPGHYRVTLLIPYQGEVDAYVGMGLPGGRHIKSITGSSVMVFDPKIGEVTLGFGDSVPSSPSLEGGNGIPLARPISR
jgi:type IV pilus biogenesis protein PilP